MGKKNHYRVDRYEGRDNSTDPSQNVQEDRFNKATRQSFENSDSTTYFDQYEDDDVIEEDYEESIEIHRSNDDREAHIKRLRQALLIIQEELNHLENKSATTII